MSRIHAALLKAEKERAATLTARSVPMDARLPVAESPPSEDSFFKASLRLPRFTQAIWKLDPTYLFEPRGTRKNVNVAAEAFRGLASALHVADSKAQIITLLISSVLPGEGKSTASLNLAYALAQSGKHVLLVDGDLRNPKLHAILGIENRVGLACYLEDRADQAAIVQEGSVANLYFAPAGVASRHPSELINSTRFQEFVHWARRHFDWVVVDTAPAAVVSDASLMSHHFDGVLLVVQSGATPHDLAEKVRASFPPERLLGVILNRAETGRTYDSYYYQGAG